MSGKKRRERLWRDRDRRECVNGVVVPEESWEEGIEIGTGIGGRLTAQI